MRVFQISGRIPGEPKDPQPFLPIAEILKRRGIWLDKNKSQHFLRRQEVCMQIARLARITKEDLVVEVGAGLGNLTVELGARAGKVFSVEMDRTFEDWHGGLSVNYPALEFHYADFLQTDLERAVAERSPDRMAIGVGNLPYQITSAILFKFVDSPLTFRRLVFMVQKEVAERVAVGAGHRECGALTYKIALRYQARIAMHIAPEEFLPPPKVWSSILVLEPLATPLVGDPTERERVYALVDKLFQFRRKTLSNGLLMGGLAPDRGAATAALTAAQIDPQRRPETLSLEELLALHGALRPSP
jgi:16S rRNA (adenine1518-N6/adenine1519-N6)-dimethyltransferase